MKLVERAIRLLAPIKKRIKGDQDEDIYIIKGFMPVSVFDKSQTEGPEIDVGASDMIQGNVSFEELAKKCLIPVRIKDLGLTNGRTDGTYIWISPRSNEAEMVSTALHEWSHCWLGHLDKTEILHEDDTKSTHELEAESCSFIVSSFLGLDNKKSKYYLGSWGARKDQIKGRGRKIITTA